MAESAFDLSEILVLYKEDARRMAGQMQDILKHWEEVTAGGSARHDLRRLSHQLRGSGRTYGFCDVTRICKAIESIVMKLEKGLLTADTRTYESIRKKVERLTAVFAK